MVGPLQLRIRPYFHQEVCNSPLLYFFLKKVNNSILKYGKTGAAMYHEIKKKTKTKRKPNSKNVMNTQEEYSNIFRLYFHYIKILYII